MRPKETKEVVEMIKRIENGGGSVDIATEINENSTNDEAAGAKAVYDFAAPKPSFPTMGNTVAYISEGDQISLDCVKLSELMSAKNISSKLTNKDEFMFGAVYEDAGAEFFDIMMGHEDGTTSYDWYLDEEEGQGETPDDTYFTDFIAGFGTITTTAGSNFKGGAPVDLGVITIDSNNYYVSQEEISRVVTITRPSE